MQAYLQYIVIASICLSITFLFYKLLLVNRTVVKTIRFYFLCSIAISLLAPLSPWSFRIPYPPHQPTVDNKVEVVEYAQTGGQEGRVVTTARSKQVDYVMICTVVYLVMAMLLLANTAVQVGRLLLCYQRADKEKIDGGQIVWNTQFKAPFSFFKWIYLNKTQINSNDLEKILAHEKVHARQCHSIDALLMDLLRALMWFNPFIWKMRNAVQLTHEYLADEGVLQAGVNKIQYQQLLLNRITESHLMSLSSALNHSLIKKRFLMMSNQRSAPVTRFRILFLAPVTGLLLLGIGCVNGQTVADKPKVAVAPVKMNVLYIGIENPVDISVSGYTPDQVTVSTDNGIIEGTNGEYIVKPKTPGKAVITVSANGKVIRESEFRVKFLPEPVVALNSPAGSSRLVKGGSITQEALLKSGGIIATIEGAEFDVPIKVSSFALSTITAGNNQTSEAVSDNGKFTSAQETIIKGLSDGQKIIIDDITASGPDGKSRKMPVSMVFTIVKQ